MTPTEKLQRLIEIAWENGWQFGQDYYKQFHRADLVAETILSGVLGGQDEWIAGFEESENSILFEKDFIKALCRAKYQERTGLIFNGTSENEGFGIVLEPWQAHIARLAISDNRLDYLWQIFGGEG